MIPKIQNIQYFQKTGTYVIHLLVVYQCTKLKGPDGPPPLRDGHHAQRRKK